MNLLQNIRGRIGAAIAAVVVGIGLFGCGLMLAFVISPQQALEWRRIQNLPELDAAGIASAETGTDLAVTGHLRGNAAIGDTGLVLYEREQWEVEPADDNDNTPDGTWKPIEEQYPALKLEVTGGVVDVLAADSMILSLVPHESVEDTNASLSASYNGDTLHDGAIRTKGFADGDLVTVVGKKASTGGIAPEHLAGGDRVQLIEDIRSGARAAFTVGVIFMICAPIAIILGVVGAIFGRKR